MDGGIEEPAAAEADWPSIAERVARRCAEYGLDLVHPFCADWFDDSVPAAERLSSRRGALAMLVGNTRALWPRFLDALASDRTLEDEAHPIDRYTERSISESLASLSCGYEVRFAHQPPFVPMQRLAERAGFAFLAPSRLSVHPEFGPWIALRAVVVFDIDGPTGPAPRLEVPCADCANACEPALSRALAGPDDWRLWVSVRDACPLGAQHRYSEEQIHYHYTKDLGALRRALGRRHGA